MSTSQDDSQRDPARSGGGRVSRRGIFPLFGAAATVAALAPAGLASAAGTSSPSPELLASQAGTLAGNPGGAFAEYQISQPSGTAITLTLTYNPFDVTVAHGVGFHVYQAGGTLASATGQSLPLGDPSNNNAPTATFTPNARGGPVLVQVFNYSRGTISYSLTSSVPGAVVSGGPAPARYVYIGTYSAPNTAPGGTSPSTAVGIYVYKMNPSDGGLAFVQALPVDNPSFLAVDPAKKFLYSTNELGTINGKPGGMVSAFAIDQRDGKLTFLNQALTDGTAPAHLSVHPSGKYLLASNYSTGNFPIYAIQPDGRIGRMTDLVQDQGVGTGPNPSRQEGPHAHMITTDPNAGHVVCVDLGADKVFVWTLDLKTGKLSPNTVPYAQVASGSGCRHIAFHPASKFAYVIAEMASSITAYHYDPARGAFIWLQTVSTLPPNFTGSSAGGEIRMHPTGSFVYGTNRGHNSVVGFAIDQNSGMLSPINWWSTQGSIPRGMNIDPSGTFLYAANQNSNSIAVFRIDPSSGNLGQSVPLVQSP
ncbi:MAG: lactonase family protein, partial [Chloroflexota bacterium]